MDLEKLKSSIESILSYGDRVATSSGILLHGNLRSLEYLVGQLDAALIDWNGIKISTDIMLKEMENEISKGHVCNCSAVGDVVSKRCPSCASKELHRCNCSESEAKDKELKARTSDTETKDTETKDSRTN